MKKHLAKLALTATLALAITLTLTACEEKKKQDGTTTTEPIEEAKFEAEAANAYAAMQAEKAKFEAEEKAAAAEIAAKGSFIDTRDNKTYKAVKIGEQVWMAEDLNYEAKGSKCNENQESNCQSYDWETAKSACPSGWHLPTEDEWKELLYSGNSEEELTEKMKSEKTQNWWTSSGGDDNWATVFHIDEECGEDVCTHTGGTLKKFELSVRCVHGDVEAKAAKEKAEVEAYIRANSGTFTDTRDKKTYKIIKINGQVWLAENLNYEAESSVCYDKKPENCAKYGRLYNWETAMKACPSGWHLPSNEELDKLIEFAGGKNSAGHYLKATSGWYQNGNGTDKFGFSALPGGYGDSDRGFQVVGIYCYWWNSSEYNALYAYSWYMERGAWSAGYHTGNKKDFRSIRCIKD